MNWISTYLPVQVLMIHSTGIQYRRYMYSTILQYTCTVLCNTGVQVLNVQCAVYSYQYLLYCTQYLYSTAVVCYCTCIILKYCTVLQYRYCTVECCTCTISNTIQVQGTTYLYSTDTVVQYHSTVSVCTGVQYLYSYEWCTVLYRYNMMYSIHMKYHTGTVVLYCTGTGYDISE